MSASSSSSLDSFKLRLPKLRGLPPGLLSTPPTGTSDLQRLQLRLLSETSTYVRETTALVARDARAALAADASAFKLGRFPRFLEDVEAECRRYYLEPSEFQGLDLAAIVGAVAERLPDEVRRQCSGCSRVDAFASP